MDSLLWANLLIEFNDGNGGNSLKDYLKKYSVEVLFLILILSQFFGSVERFYSPNFPQYIAEQKAEQEAEYFNVTTSELMQSNTPAVNLLTYLVTNLIFFALYLLFRYLLSKPRLSKVIRYLLFIPWFAMGILTTTSMLANIREMVHWSFYFSVVPIIVNVLLYIAILNDFYLLLKGTEGSETER